jgi:putative phage-type endonuclease
MTSLQIKNLIKKDHEDKPYKSEELIKILKTIQLSKKASADIIIPIIKQYLTYNSETDQYSFNFKKRQTIDKKFHNTFIDSVSETDIFEVSKEEIKTDPTSDELNLLETKIFNKSVVSLNKPNSVTEKVKIFEEEIKKLEPKVITNYFDAKSTADYKYPIDNIYNYKKPTSTAFDEPYGTQWYHDEQVDDIITEKELRFQKQFKVLRAIKLPEQRTPEWFAMRDGKITASDGGTVVNVNHHEPQYKFVLKKTLNPPFLSNEFVHHGKKYEDTATFIYEYRMNVTTEEFGLIGHPVYDFLGASPDRICNAYKLDGIHKSKLVGRMLEIKCPYVRKIKHEGEIYDNICPSYYWVQTQLQLECCNLEECDFWQCTLKEYDSRFEFNSDTDADEPFKSKETGKEKGCIIQLLPKNKMAETLEKKVYDKRPFGKPKLTKYEDVVYEHSKYIYPPKIEMSPLDCDIWISETINGLKYDSQYDDYYFDKVLYWKLTDYSNVLINRDRDWFEKNLPELKRVWGYVLYLRANKDKLDILVKYIDSKYRKMNDDIMEVIDKLCDCNNPKYAEFIRDIKDETVKKKISVDDSLCEFEFIDEPKPKKIIKKVVKKVVKKEEDTYGFI